MNGKFIVIDGSTGSGKSTIIRAVKDWAKDSGLRYFDLADWCLNHDAPPEFSDIEEFDLLFTFEPTKNWIGSAIRYEMSQTENPYTGLELAQAFSLDRLIMYKRLIIPALKAGKVIIQDRSVTSSIAIQPVLPGGPTLDEIMNLPGNIFAITHAPTDLILTDLAPELIEERISKRAEYTKGVFEDIELIKKVAGRFKADWFLKTFTDRGTEVHTIDTSLPFVEMKENVVKLIDHILSK
ncbi:hypothetical protein COY25_01935 [Candidatus Uhrbacteria bacterium CG_4_10_14_0_2_um_filter_41_7]|uniref:Thymidylate kinase n=1 Tax=Candidatus Uhrbacteria bacterium CG_4_9_14_3_um_filter_41_35 TaxID=1975034 RepID=A0A2M7XFU3_9BACT|nr:MAG: hypothetical protein COV92_02935 [Candidatus Uhrbacteria bacterium CG11_big_fil_rev_8_21_14_0_20_41_9]PIZ54586.1 MAG: hypothetical protein COY25_01935 [Candidatus Uhrbacteria bacterium CG_4_10_14_0_2_um_filter_41_7]PJA46747.1 MAG: hypothetical protein CO173_01490 [Candidatus Uhrbacteria bacterium CG_4_9_14_3_um_filter_41_35]